jgi:hypothetical protein
MVPITVKLLSIVFKGTAKINDNCGEVIYMGVVQGPVKVNDAWVKTMDRGFAVVCLCLNILTVFWLIIMKYVCVCVHTFSTLIVRT